MKNLPVLALVLLAMAQPLAPRAGRFPRARGFDEPPAAPLAASVRRAPPGSQAMPP